MSNARTRTIQRLDRDGYTWFLYAMLAVFGYHQSVLGSITPFLRDEMTLTKVEIGWHFSVYAMGLFLAGRLATRVSGRFGAGTVMVAAAWLMVGFIALLAVPMTMPGTLTAALLLGLAGGTLQVAIQEAIARHHGDRQGIALTEGFVFGGLGVFAGPLVIGLAVKLGLGWRETLFVPAVLLAVLFLVARNTNLPKPAADRSATANIPRKGKLPLAVVIVLGMILLGIATEWGLGFWGAQFLEVHLSIPPSSGVTLMAFFFGGTVVGRLVVSRLLQLFQVRTMLIVAIILGGASVFVLWALPVFPVALVALTLAGMCLGNFFPLILAIANAFSPDRPNAISAGATQAVGLALLLVPLVLGRLGETIGLSNAVGLLAVLPLAMLALLVVSTSLRAKAPA